MKFPSLKISGMKIITKMILSFLIILILSMATIGFLVYELNNIKTIMVEKLYSTFIVTSLSVETEKELRNFDYNLKSFITALEAENTEEATAYTTQLLASYKAVHDHLNVLKKWVLNEKDKKLLNDVEELFKSWAAAEKGIVRQVIMGQFTEILEIVKGIGGNMEELIRGFYLMNIDARATADASYKSAQKTIEQAVLISGIISVALIAIVVLIAIFLSRNIFKSLSSFKEIFSKGASGELDTSYPVKEKARDEINELGILFNKFMGKVREAISEVMDVSNDLGVSSDELSATISNFSDNSQNQAASSEEITATMEEISAGIDNVSDNSQFQFDKLNDFIDVMKELSENINSMAGEISDAEGLSKSISEQANAGNESLNLMSNIMSKITESSNKVSDIVGIINDISDKINLLSLNAAIEAARAGEAGRGFAVVADEISKLADQTASSIKDIDSLIKKNKDDIGLGLKNVVNTVDNISQIIEGVESIYSMMNKIFSTMEEQQKTNATMNRSADDLKERSDEVRTASEEQRNAVSEVMKSITNINDLVQATAAGSEEMSANASKLASMAENLKNKVNFFKV